MVLRAHDAFLLQVDSTRKNYVPSKFADIPGIPIFAEDVLLHNRFTIDDESLKLHPDFKKLKTNDYVIVFCNSLVPHSPNQIKFIFQVSAKIGKQVILKVYTKLNRGYTLEHLRSLIDEGKLSKHMNSCGVRGFKISQVEYSDLELLVNFDPIVRTYHSTSWKA